MAFVLQEIEPQSFHHIIFTQIVLIILDQMIIVTQMTRVHVRRPSLWKLPKDRIVFFVTGKSRHSLNYCGKMRTSSVAYLTGWSVPLIIWKTALMERCMHTCDRFMVQMTYHYSGISMVFQSSGLVFLKKMQCLPYT